MAVAVSMKVSVITPCADVVGIREECGMVCPLLKAAFFLKAGVL